MLFWYCRADQPPALHLARPHVDDWRRWPLIAQEARRGLRKERAELLDHVEGIEHDLGQQHDALARLKAISGMSAKSPSTTMAPVMPLATCTSADPW